MKNLFNYRILLGIFCLMLIPFAVNADEDPKEAKACESARQESKNGNLKAWENYLEKFPQGKCLNEAIADFKKYGGGQDRMFKIIYRGHRDSEATFVALYESNKCIKRPTETLVIFTHDENGNTGCYT